MMDSEGCLIALLAVILVVAMIFLIPWLELWLWGVVMVPIFGAPTLTYWQMFALNWLCGLLFRRGGNINTSKK